MSKDTRQLESFKILVIGDSCDDIYHYGECLRISQEAPVPIFKHLSSKRYGGMAKNVYNNLSSLGHSVELITNSKKIVKERFIDQKSMYHILRCDRGESSSIDPVSSEEIAKIDFNNFDAIVISDYDKGFLNEVAIKLLVKSANKHNIALFVDSKKKDLSCFNGCIIKINEFEYRDAIRIPDDSEIIITMGRDGASWRDSIFSAFKSEIENLETDTSIKALRSSNVSGAGDTFLAGLVHKYLITNDMKESIVFANFCGSKSVENFGTYVLSKEDLK